MISTLLTFGGEHFEYSDEDIKTKGLTIGGYELAFHADLVASYLFENYNNTFKEVLWNGMYIDYGLLVFNGNKSLSDIKNRHMTSKVGLKNRRQIIFTAHVQTLEAKCKPINK